MLKWFGAGAAIVPVFKGAPILEAKVELIEPPRVQMVSRALPPLDPRKALSNREELDVMVILRDRKDGSTCVIEGKTFLVSSYQNYESFYTYDSPWATYIPAAPREVFWEIKGMMTGPVDYHSGKLRF